MSKSSYKVIYRVGVINEDERYLQEKFYSVLKDALEVFNNKRGILKQKHNVALIGSLKIGHSSSRKVRGQEFVYSGSSEVFNLVIDRIELY